MSEPWTRFAVVLAVGSLILCVLPVAWEYRVLGLVTIIATQLAGHAFGWWP